ncbi:protein fluG [Aspergillus udagawae]|nr:protein fluG [Aspergillus udagawae]GFG21964.1 protein fluG [Aspergillus udagawae]
MTVEQHTSPWDNFVAKHGNVEFVWLQFMSYRSLIYTRMFPMNKFKDMVQKGKFITIPEVALILGPGDIIPEDGSPASGKFWLRPDFDTVYCQPGSNGTRAVIMCDFVDDEGTPTWKCARSQLRALEETLVSELECSALVGFEIEVMFMRVEKSDGVVRFSMANYEHSWSSMTAEDESMLEMLETIARKLAMADVPLEQFHAEAAPGQWEFVLPPARPIQAADMLIRARETIKRVATSFGYHATVYSRPSPVHPGNGGHVHLSVSSVGESENWVRKAESFFAGIMSHMPAIMAFSLPQDISYSRVAAGIWSGGEYACWGWENKEVPLRRIEENHFEFKLADGLANPYLTLSAMIAAGIEGMRNQERLQGGDCVTSASALSPGERQALGITTMLPKSLDESLNILESDIALRKLCGPVIISTYVLVKRTEAKILRQMVEDDRKTWLIARY